MPTPGDDQAVERARAELRAVQDAAVMLALLMARFAAEAERLAALLRELDGRKA
ncbi:MAG TPA: hypothetical protein VNU96_10175 [Burkholderiales bacterium]|jgi:hypothetical protein|nr:hypothetical protein [Burkholderiales bacterium]